METRKTLGEGGSWILRKERRPESEFRIAGGFAKDTVGVTQDDPQGGHLLEGLFQSKKVID